MFYSTLWQYFASMKHNAFSAKAFFPTLAAKIKRKNHNAKLFEGNETNRKVFFAIGDFFCLP
jgi:hypothetical protein